MSLPLRSALVVLLSLPFFTSAAGCQTGGVIEGRLTGDFGPLPRTAPRYPAGVAAAKGMQRVPPVVYLTGERLGPVGGSADGVRASEPAATIDIAQHDTVFVPPAVAIRTGTVVRFPNADPFFHNVFSYARNARFDLGRYPEGHSREVRFAKEGIARIYCEIHEFMRAVVLVTRHPFGAVADEDGSFRFEGVPAGEYTLVAYHPDVGLFEGPVVVRQGETVRVDLRLGR